MSSLQNDFFAGLNEVMQYSPAQFCYLSGSTPLTASVYQSYGFNVRYDTDTFEYQKIYEDNSIIGKITDIGSWGIEPKKSLVYVDGEKFMVGGVVTYAADYLWISLRRYTSVATSPTP